jgi:hypothetical protein
VFEIRVEIAGSTEGPLCVTFGGGVIEMLVEIAERTVEVCPASQLFAEIRSPNPPVRKRQLDELDYLPSLERALNIF